MKLFVSPHNDDAVLFGAYTLLREKPWVLTVFDSHAQVERGYALCDWRTRRIEDEGAVGSLGCGLGFCAVSDGGLAGPSPGAIEAPLRLHAPRKVSEVWLPAYEDGGHSQHNLVSTIGTKVFAGAKLHYYLTYTDKGKSRSANESICNGAMVLKKLEALACYKTQLLISELGCWPHFLDLREYYA